MLLLAHIASAIVIALHACFVLLEMALWKRKAPAIFDISRAFAEQSAALASNQGLYNGFLVVALILGYIHAPFMLYGLGCVVVAGIWGAITVSKRIFFVQALPALIALALYGLGQ